MSVQSVYSCTHCGERVSDGDTFCEACGARLKPALQPSGPATPMPTGSCRCGATPENFDADGFCMQCGRKREVIDPRDHVELELNPALAAVTDKGIRHKRNEDDFALAAHPKGTVIVVSDGVSSASNSNVASRTASLAARDELVHSLEHGEDLAVAATISILRAHQATLTIPAREEGRSESPGTTIVVAIVSGDQVTVAWSGDSRAYWLGNSQQIQLTRDHSWLTEIVESGAMTEAEAEKDSRAHAITQCVGPLNGGPPEPNVIHFQLTEPGFLLLCTDGLWGYAKTPAEIKGLLVSDSPLENARNLVTYANHRGGIDNVTAAIYQYSKPT